MYGKVFVEIMGSDNLSSIGDEFQIANFKVEYSRNVTALGQRTRTIKVDRQNTRQYVATNTNKGDAKWNADCIFASDNNMEYGFGLLMNPQDGSTDQGKFMQTVGYGSGTGRPEQHLANRAANYWENSRRVISMPLMSTGLCGDIVAGEISPRNNLTLDGTTGHPISISHNWRDDITIVTILEV
jgi:hypothetical protein